VKDVLGGEQLYGVGFSVDGRYGGWIMCRTSLRSHCANDALSLISRFPTTSPRTRCGAWLLSSAAVRKPLIPQITPFRIVRFDQRELPRALPLLHQLLSGNR
jgi:hypothetical protein